MRIYKREHYNIKAYKEERYSMEIYDRYLGTSITIYNKKWEPLYAKAKEESKNGKRCTIHELKYEFIP